MLNREKWYQSGKQRLQRADTHNDLDGRYTLLLQVELGLYLLNILGQDKAVDTVWVLLTNHPFTELDDLNDAQRQALARARYLLRFGRYAWSDAIKWYSSLLPKWRMYTVESLDRPARINNAMTKMPDREKYYRNALFKPTPFKTYSAPKVKAGETIFFKGQYGQPIPVVFNVALLRIAEESDSTLPTLPDAPVTPKPPVRVSFNDLKSFARWVEQRERDIGSSRRWSTVIGGLIRYRNVSWQDGNKHSLGEVNQGDLVIDGMAHVAGMVGSGKTTLANLLAMYGAEQGGWRTTLVVGDTHSAIERADYFNRVLGAPPEQPVAVVLMGRTTREAHLRRLSDATSVQGSDALRHWGFQWLDTVCLVQGLVAPEQMEKPLPPGKEPCEHTLFRTKKDGRNEFIPCPLFSVCPSRQVYHQIPKARIWITTPGALAYSRLPVQMDSRRLTYAEMIYHYADLVVFDEIDADQEQFDAIYAPEHRLISTDHAGMLERLDRNSAGWFSWASSNPRGQQRWNRAFQHSTLVADHVCSMLDNYQDLQDWSRDLGFFSGLTLFRDIAASLADLLPESQTAHPHVNTTEQSLFWKWFWKFQEADKFKPEQTAGRVQELFNILREIPHGGSLTGAFAHDLSRRWIRNALTDANEGDEIQIADDELARLARRLELAVSTAALNSYLYIVSEEYPEDQPQDEHERLQRAPAEFAGSLPSAPFGLSQGFRYAAEKTHADDGFMPTQRPRSLVMFRYQAIGRFFLMNFHRLRRDVGYPGPNVLAMSGTSWMPASATNHFDVHPVGLLEPNTNAQESIAKSEFAFSPILDDDGNPIQVSGSGNIDRQLRKLAMKMANHLKNTMRELERRASEDTQGHWERRANEDTQGHWENRGRILLFVNSYSQAKGVAENIVHVVPEWKDEVFYLERSTSEDGDRWVPSLAGSLPRANLEAFGLEHKKRVLVAPLGAVGRRHNILNVEEKAAFGSVYFLTRPMPTPDDLSQWTRWLNRLMLRMCRNPQDPLWMSKNGQFPNTLVARERRLRSRMAWEWSRIGLYKGYSMLPDSPTSPNTSMLNNLAATMTARIIQASGRLLRGDVPFLAYFVDQAWAPNSAQGKPDTTRTSILVNMIRLLDLYVQEPLGAALYAPLYEALAQTKNLHYTRDWNTPR